MPEYPNYVAQFIQAREAGRQNAVQRQRSNALAMYGKDPVGAENALMSAGDVEGSNALLQRRVTTQKFDTEQAAAKQSQAVGMKMAAGDTAGARNAAGGNMGLLKQIGEMDDATKAALAKKNAQVGGIAYHLLQEKDPAARQQLAHAAIPVLVQQGVLPEGAQIDLSDEGLQTYVSQALELKDVIAQGNKDREFTMTRADKEADNKRADAQFGETQRHNKADESVAGARLGLEGQRVAIARQSANGADGGSPFSAQGLDLAATQYAKTGTLPPTGMGKAGSALRTQIINRAAEITTGQGMSAADVIADRAGNKASGQAMGAIAKTAAAVTAAEKAASDNADLMLSKAKKGAGPTSIPFANGIINHIRAGTGNTDVAEFNAALGTFTDEYAKVVAGATGSAGASDAARRSAESRINGAQTHAQLEAVVRTLKQDMDNKSRSLRDQVAAQGDTIRGGPAGGAKADPLGIR